MVSGGAHDVLLSIRRALLAIFKDGLITEITERPEHRVHRSNGLGVFGMRLEEGGRYS